MEVRGSVQEGEHLEGGDEESPEWDFEEGRREGDEGVSRRTQGTRKAGGSAQRGSGHELVMPFEDHLG